MAKKGVSKNKLENAYNKSREYTVLLSNYLADYASHVEELNAVEWYGGRAATKWYDAANAAYKKDLKFYNNITTVNKSVKKIVNKLKNATK